MDKKSELSKCESRNILRKLREEKGLTRKWISTHSDIGLRQVAAIELGEKYPSVVSLLWLIRCMGVSSGRIFYPELSAKDTQIESIMRLLVS